MILELISLSFLFLSLIGWGAWLKCALSIKTDSVSTTAILGITLFSIITGLLIFSLIPYAIPKLRVHLAKFNLEALKPKWFWCFLVMIVLVGSYHTFRPDHYLFLFIFVVKPVAFLDTTMGIYNRNI